MVHSTNGPSNVRINSLIEAEAEAERLAKKHVGISFYVLKTIKCLTAKAEIEIKNFS